jgi:NADH-quinone oxidoreductase subunit K
MHTDVTDYLVVGAVLFALGALGFITRRNLIVAILCAEMMLHGVSLNLVAFSYQHGTYEGQVFTAIVLTVAACEAGLALALLSALYRLSRTLDMSVWRKLGEPGVEPLDRPEPPPEPAAHDYPRLTPAGKVPRPVMKDAAPQETRPHE